MGAAFAAWQALGYSAQYVPCNHGEAAPDVTGRDVFILDFSFEPDVLLALAATARSVHLIDHHKTAWDKLRGLTCPDNLQIYFDMSKSGAHLSWNHFHPGKPLPHLISRIEDRDLWQWKFTDTKPYLAMLDALPLDFEKWAEFNAKTQDPTALSLLLSSGDAVLARHKRQVADMCEGAFELEFMGTKVLAVNVSGEFISDVGSELALKTGTFALVFKVDKPDLIKVSMRSVKQYDCSSMAVAFGGGGHPQACSFRINLTQFGELLNGTLRP